jgi:hypothetical protein
VPQPRTDASSLEIDVVEAPPRARTLAPARTRSLAPPFGVSTTSAPAVTKLGLPRRRHLVWALALVACCMGYAAVRRATRPSPPVTPPLAISPVAAGPPAPAPRAAAAAAPAAVAASITLELDSKPRGAAVLGEAGELLGLTPLSVPLPRSTTARRSFTISKAGYHSAVYELTPERDSTAFIELPRAHHTGRAVSTRPQHGTRARTLGDGLTIDPF